MTWYFIMHVLLCVAIYGILGGASLKAQFVYAAAGLFYQCWLNYVTHYGLHRNKDKNGNYESISKYHSWSFPSSPIMWRLSRHPDHHACSFRPY